MLSMDKAQILAKFSKDPDSYYRVELFDDEGFERKRCTTCQRYFWTQEPDQILCPDDDVERAYTSLLETPQQVNV